MFGRATIRLGIGPHSSFKYSTLFTLTVTVIMAALCNRGGIIFLPCGFFMVALCNRADHYIFMLWFVVVLLLFYLLT